MAEPAPRKELSVPLITVPPRNASLASPFMLLLRKDEDPSPPLHCPYRSERPKRVLIERRSHVLTEGGSISYHISDSHSCRINNLGTSAISEVQSNSALTLHLDRQTPHACGPPFLLTHLCQPGPRGHHFGFSLAIFFGFPAS